MQYYLKNHFIENIENMIFNFYVFSVKYLALPLVYIRQLAALNATDCNNIPNGGGNNNLIIFLTSPPITRKNNYHEVVRNIKFGNTFDYV